MVMRVARRVLACGFYIGIAHGGKLNWIKLDLVSFATDLVAK